MTIKLCKTPLSSPRKFLLQVLASKPSNNPKLEGSSHPSQTLSLEAPLRKVLELAQDPLEGQRVLLERLNLVVCLETLVACLVRERPVLVVLQVIILGGNFFLHRKFLSSKQL